MTDDDNQTDNDLNKVDNLFSEPDSTLTYDPREQENTIDQNKESYMNWLRDRTKNISQKGRKGYNKIQGYNDKITKKIKDNSIVRDIGNQVSDEGEEAELYRMQLVQGRELDFHNGIMDELVKQRNQAIKDKKYGLVDDIDDEIDKKKLDIFKMKQQFKKDLDNYKNRPTVYKAAGMLSKQAKHIPNIRIGSIPTLNRVPGFNRSFVRPSAGEVEGKFTLTRNTPVAVSTGGFGTENEFARNENTNINTPTGKISGGLSSRGSLAINMGKTEEPAQLSFTHLHQESYEVPNELSNFVKMKTIGNSVNRGLMRSNLRNDATYIRAQPEPTFMDQYLVNFQKIKQEQSIPISSSIGQDRINYAKTTSNTSGNAHQGVKRIKSSPLMRYKQLEMKKVNVNLNLKSPKRGKPTSQKSSENNYSKGIAAVLNRNIAKVNTKKISKRKK